MFKPLEEWREQERRQKEFVGYLAADQRAKAAHHAKRTAKSANTRREKTRVHWSTKWLQEAHNLHPDYGAERLALEARKHIALNCKGMPEFAKRDEITEYRAAQYLKTPRRT
jgi:hypothetical protein